MLFAASFVWLPIRAQRVQQPLGRGVVAVQNGTNVTVTWRRLAQDPEDCLWNVYVTQNDEAKKLNNQPLQANNLRVSAGQIPVGASVSVTRVNATDGTESEPSAAYERKSQTLRNIFVDIRFGGGSPLENAKYDTKYVWPVDIDGNGEFDYIVDRLPVSGGHQYLEAYMADGTYLWTVDMGPNELISFGQSDQVTAYDFDCDGFGDVIVQTSDGTRFWDRQAKTWGRYVGGGDNPDTDGDGIVDYEQQSVRNAPRYISVIDARTGAEKAFVEQQYNEHYNRTNRAALMGDEYNRHTGHCGIFYHDGVHPAYVMEWCARTVEGKRHYYYNSAFAFEYDAEGKATQLKQLFQEPTGGAVFHSIRILDADGDGCDEMCSGGYMMDNNGSTLCNSGIAHGDRFRISDINPDRPGLEVYAIQQDAPDMLGQILWDAATGEPIKKWYLSAVGDVGRGECLDLDPAHKGWELFSFVNDLQVYNAEGDAIPGMKGYWPTEGVWWDGELDRENVAAPDGDGYNAMIVDYKRGRLFEIAKESGWAIRSSNAMRAKFWGDIIGDWREELVLNRYEGNVNVGIVGFSTDVTTSVSNIYCLMQDPHYRQDCTTKGYYQSPNPGFYLGYDMPRPQLPPVIQDDDRNQVAGLTLGSATVQPRQGIDNLYLMPVKGQTLTLGAAPEATATVWKSQQGAAVVPQGMELASRVIVSEGALQVDGNVKGIVDLRARGTLSGCGTVDSLTLEGALNYDGGRLMPRGTLTVGSTLDIAARTFVETDIRQANLLLVRGDLRIAAPLVFTIPTEQVAEGSYTLVQCTGSIAGDVAQCRVRGLTGKSYDIRVVENKLVLTVHGQREALQNVAWTGNESAVWDYQTANWLAGDEPTGFVSGDGIVFDDRATATTISAPDLMPAQSMLVDNTDKNFVFNGEGGLSGAASLTKQGAGRLTLNTTKSDYTGNTYINGGTVVVKELADAGMPSSLGSGNATAGSITIGKATLSINNSNTSTNRPIILTDTATLQIPTGAASLKGRITGNGTLCKTGGGQLNITYAGANSWAATILEAGTLAQGAWNSTFGAATSTIHVTGNTTLRIFDTNTGSQAPNIQNKIDINKGKTLKMEFGRRCSFTGALLGEGTVNMTFPYVRADLSMDGSKFQGTLNINSANGRLTKATDLSQAKVNLVSGANLGGYKGGSGNTQNLTHKIGALTGEGELYTGTWNVGYKETNVTFAGNTASDATLNKVGTGKLTLSGTLNGALNVQQGTAVATGTLAAVTVKAGATLQAGTVVSAKPALTGRLRVESNGCLQLTVSSSSKRCSQFVVSGVVSLASPVIVLNDVSANPAYADGMELQIFNAAQNITLTGTPTLLPERPAEGLAWDLSALETDGIIRVKADATAIGGIRADELGGKCVYDLNGRRVMQPQRGNIYIVDGKKIRVE